MSARNHRWLGLIWFVLASASGADLQLTLPPFVYAVPGVPVSVFHDNIVLTEHPEAYRFEIHGPAATNEARRWAIQATGADAGDHLMRVRVLDESGAVLAQGEFTLRVARQSAGEGRPLKLLIIGDSLTAATLYPNELARLLSGPGNPEWVMLGTSKPASAAPGVAHEGYGGWTWSNFLTKYEAAAPGVAAGPLAKKSTSPFIFDGHFDLNRYFRESCGGQFPDVVIFLLGINDCFGANPDDPTAHIDRVLDNAEKLLAAFREACPKAKLAVGLTTPPNARESGFEANYQGKYHRWGWKRIQHRLVGRMLERFAGREAENLFLVPTHLNLDPVDGYPENNGVHPNATGYGQIAASFYAWLKAMAFE